MQRRDFVQFATLSALYLYVQGCRGPAASASAPLTRSTKGGRFGPLISNPDAMLDLPKDFQYVVLQQFGDALSDGYSMPRQPDGMACFTDPSGHLILLRNHELGQGTYRGNKEPDPGGFNSREVPKPRYKEERYGSVVRVVVDPKQLEQDFAQGNGLRSTAVKQSHFVLAGTHMNCAGGVVPEGWVTCEESDLTGHGYAFLTRPSDKRLMRPRKLKSWGRFRREAIALDPQTGIVYMTEDHVKGCFYRHVPNNPKNHLGPGTLQALKIEGVPTTNPSSAEPWGLDKEWTATWVDIPDPEAEELNCRGQGELVGATQFCRGEGLSWDGQSIWFAATSGGPAAAGQIFRFIPDADQNGGRVVLKYEVTDRSILSCPDNALITPWGDLLMCEDNYNTKDGVTNQHLRGLRPTGEVYDIARNRQNNLEDNHPGTEFTGACFSPDGQYLFVNLQHPLNVTVVIRGPWPTV